MDVARDRRTRDLLARRVESTPDATATIDAASGRESTYREVDAAVGAAVDRLDAHLEPSETSWGDRPGIAVAATVDEAFVSLLFAAWRLGAVVVPVDPATPPGRLRRRLRRARVDLLVRSSGGPALPEWDRPSAVVDVPLDAGEAAGGERDPAAWEPDETALILFTSGTTGEPKGVRLTRHNLSASAVASALRLGVDPADRWLACLPTNHTGGLAPVVRSVLYGTAVVLQPETDPDSLAETMAATDVTGVSLVPTMLGRLLDAGWEPPETLRFVLLGGAPADEDLLARCARRDVPVHPTYGTTETASQIATATPAQVAEHPGTVGQPLLGTDVAVLDEEGAPCPPGVVGEVVVDGPTVSPGYLDAAATREAVDDRGLHTGDLGSRDADGLLWIHGRVDDAIQSGGETVHPERVATTLRAQSGVAEAAVVGLPDDEWGERVGALVVPGDRSVDVDALIEACRAELARHEVPRTVAVADRLPRTDSGTVDRAAVRRRLAG